MTVFTSNGPTLEAEIVADAAVIRRKIVRVTFTYKPTPVVTHKVYLTVSYQVVDGGTFRFEECMGEVGWGRAEDLKIQKRAEKARKRIVDLCADRGLEVRGASFQA